MSIDFLYEIYKQHNEVSTDSRRITDGCLFFALKGETFDGNKFAAQALKDGAAAAVVDDASVVPAGDELNGNNTNGHYLLVDDVLKTLQALASHHRHQFRGPVVEVTGTNGKTTTKELLAAVLSRKYNVLYTQGNLNNHIGVPLTLLRLRPEEHEIAIIETGANHPGEIAFLANIVDPDYGLITNVGRAHLEGFGSFEGVKRTKGELYDKLSENANARIFACASNADLRSMLAEREIDVNSTKCITYAYEQDAVDSTLCTGHVVACNPMLSISWQACNQQSCRCSAFPAGPYTTATQLIGDYNLDNVLAAVCVGLHFGIAPAEIDAALTDYHPSLGRSEFRRTAHNELVVDAYNANLTSMLAALANLRNLEHPHKMVILGAMRELGADSYEAHLRVVQEVLNDGVEEAWFVGEEFEDAVAQAVGHTDVQGCTNGREGVYVRMYKDIQAVAAAIAVKCPEGRLILIKGSNSTRLHQLPDLL